MQNKLPTRPAHSESNARWHTNGKLLTGNLSTKAPTITITEIAMKKILGMRESLELPVKGLRVIAIPRSPLRAHYILRFVPEEETESPADTIQRFDDLDLFIAEASAPYLEGATIDFVFTLISSEFKVEAPLRKLDTPEGRIAAKIQRVLDEEVNPSLGTHGGGATLIDFNDGILFLELTGGCQGCGMAGATLKEGVESSIREHVPEVLEVRDITNHANGTNPYFL